MSEVCYGPIVLQNSKVAAVQIFGENLKRKEVDDSRSFSRDTEVGPLPTLPPHPAISAFER